MADADVVIETRGLAKRFGSRVAVAGLDLDVPAGEVFGFLGPNGAGKTTTVKMLLGLTRPGGGSLRVLGRPPGDPRARRDVGYLPENVHFPPWFTGFGFLRYHGALVGLPRRELTTRSREALRLLGLDGRGGDRLAGYSHGMLQRLGLAQALLARPRLVILDEPTSALDPAGRREVRDLIGRLRERGTTVFLNSHLLSEVERTCDRVAIVVEGRTRYLGPTTPDEREGALARVRYAGGPPHPGALLADVARVVPPEGGDGAGAAGSGRSAGGAASTWRLRLDDLDALPEVAARLHGAGARLYELTPVRRELEDLFLEVTGAPAAGHGGDEEGS